MNTKKKLRIAYPLTAILITGMIIAGLLLFQSCEQEEMDYQLDIPDEFKQVGKLHNQGLDHVFAAIKQKTIAHMRNQENGLKNTAEIDYQRIIHEGTLDFCRSHESLNKEIAICQKVLNERQVQLKAAAPRHRKQLSLNKPQQNAVQQISDALGSRYSKKELHKLKSELNAINRKAARDLDEHDAAVVYCATSTAYSSYQYWMKQYKKWYFALNFPEILEKYNDAQLNNLQLKNGRLLFKNASSGEPDSWWEEQWDSAEEWYYNASEATEDWWDEDGRQMAEYFVDLTKADAQGALLLGGAALITGVGAVTAAVTGGIVGSTTEAIDQFPNL
jgi:hypothetical protein